MWNGPRLLTSYHWGSFGSVYLFSSACWYWDAFTRCCFHRQLTRLVKSMTKMTSFSTTLHSLLKRNIRQHSFAHTQNSPTQLAPTQNNPAQYASDEPYLYALTTFRQHQWNIACIMTSVIKKVFIFCFHRGQIFEQLHMIGLNTLQLITNYFTCLKVYLQ